MRERLRSRTLSAPLGRSKNGLESNSREKPFVISSDSDSDEDSLLENERSSNGLERVECGEHGGAVGPGRRSGKRPSRGDDNERVGGEKKKEKVQPLHGEIEINCRVLPSRSAAMSKTEKNRGSNLSDGKRVEMEKDESDGLVGATEQV
ncbi:hypothetical protein L1049_019842 [Liquidambar formosana]|uniref:Uncharacterized protein n=1 Tax=Liquidambar formosana TaxID=63359 RepID=A0AAP0S6Z8_LIQFO